MRVVYDPHLPLTRPVAPQTPEGCARHMPETPDTNGAYPRLSQEQIRVLATQGERRAVQPRDVLFRDGDQWADFLVVLAGKVAVVEGYESEGYETTDERLLVVHGPGRAAGLCGPQPDSVPLGRPGG